MKKERIVCMIRNIILSFLIFAISVIGIILIISKQTLEITNSIIKAQVETTQQLNIFGINIMTFHSVLKDNVYVIEIMKNPYYNYIPIFFGITVLLVILILTSITKKYTQGTIKQIIEEG